MTQTERKKPTEDELARMARYYGADGVFVVLRYPDGARAAKHWGATEKIAALVKHWMWAGWDWLVGKEGE